MRAVDAVRNARKVMCVSSRRFLRPMPCQAFTSVSNSKFIRQNVTRGSRNEESTATQTSTPDDTVDAFTLRNRAIHLRSGHEQIIQVSQPSRGSRGVRSPNRIFVSAIKNLLSFNAHSSAEKFNGLYDTCLLTEPHCRSSRGTTHKSLCVLKRHQILEETNQDSNTATDPRL